jgi:hypothetical protein
LFPAYAYNKLRDHREAKLRKGFASIIALDHIQRNCALPTSKSSFERLQMMKIERHSLYYDAVVVGEHANTAWRTSWRRQVGLDIKMVAIAVAHNSNLNFISRW